MHEQLKQVNYKSNLFSSCVASVHAIGIANTTCIVLSGYIIIILHPECTNSAIMAVLTFQCVLCCLFVSVCVAVVSAKPSPELVNREDLSSSDVAFVNSDFSLFRRGI